jgi:hypothetical protein
MTQPRSLASLSNRASIACSCARLIGVFEPSQQGLAGKRRWNLGFRVHSPLKVNTQLASSFHVMAHGVDLIIISGLFKDYFGALPGEMLLWLHPLGFNQFGRMIEYCLN